MSSHTHWQFFVCGHESWSSEACNPQRLCCNDTGHLFTEMPLRCTRCRPLLQNVLSDEEANIRQLDFTQRASAHHHLHANGNEARMHTEVQEVVDYQQQEELRLRAISATELTDAQARRIQWHYIRLRENLRDGIDLPQARQRHLLMRRAYIAIPRRIVSHWIDLDVINFTDAYIEDMTELRAENPSQRHGALIAQSLYRLREHRQALQNGYEQRLRDEQHAREQEEIAQVRAGWLRRAAENDDDYDRARDPRIVNLLTPTESSEICPVCQESLHAPGAEEAVKLPCGNTFGLVCISRWLREQITCPLCRASFSNELIPASDRRAGNEDEDSS